MAQEQLNQDIKWLEAQLKAKKKELSERGAQKPEREIVKEVLKDSSAGENPPAGLPPVLPPSTVSDGANFKKTDEAVEKEHEPIVKDLVALAFSKNLASALRAARSLKNPHMLDEFHDTLADQYYEKLKAARKLK